MKPGHLLAAVLLASAAGPAFAQQLTAQGLVERNLEARGGAAALESVKSIRFKGKIIFPGDFELSYDEIRASGGPGGAQSRMEGSIQGLTYMQGYDGRSAWRVNPFQGRRDAEKMSADEVRSMADSSLIQGVLLAARGDGSSIAYLGREDFDGTPAYKLQVKQKDGDEFTYLLDPDTFLEIKIVETRRIRGAEQTTETELGDYEKIAGVYFPMSVENWPQGRPNSRQRVIIETAEANPPVNPALFAEPAGPARPAAAQVPDASMTAAERDSDKADPDKPVEAPAEPPKGE